MEVLVRLGVRVFVRAFERAVGMAAIGGRALLPIASAILLVSLAREAGAQSTGPVTTPSVATASAATSTVTSTAPTPAPLNLPFDSLRASIDRALIASKPADYERALALIDGALAQRPDDAVLLHYRGFLLYREGSYLVTTGRDAARAKSRFEAAERVLARSAASFKWPETLALQSAVVGQLIALGGPLAGMRLGAKTSRLLDEALAAGPENPRVWMLKGVSDLYRPKLFGGSTEKAEAALTRAIALFASDTPTPPAPWWGHAEAYGWLGQVYMKEGKTEQAKAAYAKALDLQPGNAWVLEMLLPAVRQNPR